MGEENWLSWRAPDVASVLDLAELSVHVYQEDPTSPLPDWSLVERYPRGPFFAALYRRCDGEHVLAVRGTEPPSLADWWNDALIITGRRVRQFPDVQHAALEALTAVAGRPLYVTGHSLGGALATLAAGTYRLPCVTFNALGISRVAARARLWDRTDYTRLLHVRSTGDIAYRVSPTVGRHLVLDYPTPPLASDALPWLALATGQPQLLYLALGAKAVAKAWDLYYQHAMNNLRDAVRREPDLRSDLRWAARERR
jgi:hypothetical protein